MESRPYCRSYVSTAQRHLLVWESSPGTGPVGRRRCDFCLRCGTAQRERVRNCTVDRFKESLQSSQRHEWLDQPALCDWTVTCNGKSVEGNGFQSGLGRT